jgi:hypothetical protein
MTGIIKQMWMYNRPDNGHSAWVALCAHATRTDFEPTSTDITYYSQIMPQTDVDLMKM